ncbi:MAG: hypothetical protein H0V72_16825 [Bradyrhizobium sp.]|nr:hypothetical protein [Bradyrhizobium sp.]
MDIDPVAVDFRHGDFPGEDDRQFSIPGYPIGFSSEVDPGSRKENTSKQNAGSLRRWEMRKWGRVPTWADFARRNLVAAHNRSFQKFILFERFQIALPLKEIGIILRGN